MVMMFLLKHRLEILVTLSCAALLGYFALQATVGGRSYHYREQLTQRLATLQGQLDTVTNDRMTLETRVAQMRPGNVDADLLDEMARRNLNLGRANEVVVTLPN